MGYPTHFPRAIVYAPIEVGGLGFCHLGHEQGVQHVLQLVKHLRAQTLNGELYRTLIDTYQITAGSARPILEHTAPFPWCPDGWLSTTRQFLHRLNTTIHLAHPWTPLPRRINDRNIMDDVAQYLPQANHRAINNVRLYLRVHYLSKITDASGITALPHVLEGGPSRSSSTLRWPHQPNPSTTAWQHWKRAIRELYLCTDSDHLVTPLKEWTGNTVNVDWTWEWQIHPTMLELYQRNGTHWKVYAPVLTRRTYVAYPLHRYRRKTLNLDNLPPATPVIDSSQEFLIVQLPIWDVRSVTPLRHVHSELLERLSTPTEKWVAPLWHRIRSLSHTDSLLQTIYNRQTIIISSDASVDAAKHSCCAWSIYGGITLWQGEGVIPGNCDDTYSGRSEAFGILTALLFLHHYLQHYPHPQHY